MPPRSPKVPFAKLLQQKQGFLLSVYATLIIQLAITFAIVYGFRNHPTLSKATKRGFLFYLLGSLGLIVLLTFFNFPPWLKLIIFTLFSVLTGAMLHNASVAIPAPVITQALAGAIGVFIAMSIFAVLLAAAGVDLSWMGLILFVAMIGLFVALIVFMFFGKTRDEETKKMTPLYKALVIGVLILFSIYILYETNIMLQKHYNLGFVDAAVGFYIDFVNVFQSILALGSE